MKFKIGDRVRLNSKITSFNYGRGGVSYDEIGKIISSKDHVVNVNFPSHNLWRGLVDEIVLITASENKGVLDKIDRYIINENATIIFWKDGIKTISKVDTEDTFNKEIGFMLAVYKYLGLYHIQTRCSKTELKRQLECIKQEKLYDFLFIEFNKYTFKDTNKSRKYLSELKVENANKKEKIEILTTKEDHKMIFRKDIFIKKEGFASYEDNQGWVDECDGREVINNRIGLYIIKQQWCEVL